MDIQESVLALFRKLYQADATDLVRAPGRVNLIGEHTDYNDGFVLPLAIDRAVWLALRPRSDQRIQVAIPDMAADPAAPPLIEIADIGAAVQRGRRHATPTTPQDYLEGVAWALSQQGFTLAGFDGVLMSDVPIGAGLSSSAAFELAIARAITAITAASWDAPLMAKLAQKAENDWVGMKCGIMDQMISATGVAGHAVLIDCRTLELTPAPLPAGAVVVVLDTNTRRGLVDSAYNERRAQCEAAARFFEVPALRDVSVGEFETRAGELGEVIRRRARHIVTENARTLEAKNAMFGGDVARLGELMNASHASLRDDFEVSSPALNAIVACAQQQPGCYGARMTGAGFGGCAVALVDEAQAAAFAAAVSACYAAATPQQATIYICRATDGAQWVRR